MQLGGQPTSACLYSVFTLPPGSSLPYREASFKPDITVEGNPVMSLQKTAGAHPLICSDSCSEENESMIHPMDKEMLQRTRGKKKSNAGKVTPFSSGVL